LGYAIYADNRYAHIWWRWHTVVMKVSIAMVTHICEYSVPHIWWSRSTEHA
jgi:hypothetical protein